MRLFNYSLGFFALVALLCFAFIEVKGHIPRVVEVKTSSYEGRPLRDAIRVYSGPALDKYEEYSILGEDFEFEILDRHSYAIGFNENILIKELKVDSVPIELKRKKGTFKTARIVEGDKHILPTNLLISKTLACFIIAFFSSFIFWSLGRLFQSDKSPKKLTSHIAVYAFALAPLIIYASIFSPALYDYDFPDSLKLASRYGLSGWFSFINYVYLGAGNIIGKFTGLGVKSHMLIQLSFFYILICFYLDLLRRAKAPKGSIVFILSILWLPSFVLFSLQISRDFWTTLLPVVSAIGLVYLKFDGARNARATIFFSLTMAIACLYRAELIIGGLVFIFGVYWTQNKSNAITSALIVFTFLFLGLFINNKIDPRASKIKLLASLSHPLGAVITSNSPKISPVERKELSKYINLPLIKEKHVDFEIMAFHSGAVNTDKAIEELGSFFKVSLPILLKNPVPVLRSRFIMFFKMIGLTGWTSGHPDDHNTHFNIKNKNLVGLLDWDIRKKDPNNYRWKIIGSQHTWFAWFYCMLPSIIICLWSIWSYRKNSACALAAFLVLSKIPVFFLLAPAAHFKYAWDIYAIGLILWPLVLAERKSFLRPLRQ